ncbi:MAG: patatin-like phospholipase family protein [Burkholderiaceae bacterium]|nr:patatin-like phospholipase family protein [Burkholderiaceae bacterium]
MPTRPIVEPADRAAASSPPAVDLALQGGGSHGAFTWGVLDALLEDGRLAFDGVSGTSAGAMNAAVLACGHARGLALGQGDPAVARGEARRALRAFWRDIAGASGCFGAPGGAATPAATSAWPAWTFNLDAWPMFGVWNAWWRQFSPYQLNPLNLNPLRDILQRHVDPALLAATSVAGQPTLKVFVTATSVRTGAPKVFQGEALTIDALLASACLPQLFQAVEIDGEAYWDGGFAGNPALWPLVDQTRSLDLLLVQINPAVREGVPTTAADIADRVNEITFNASLVAQMRAIEFVQRLIERHALDAQEYKNLRLHRVADEAGLAAYDASSKLSTDARLLDALFRLGRAAGERWLAAHADDVGVRGSTPIREVWLSAAP